VPLGPLRRLGLASLGWGLGLASSLGLASMGLGMATALGLASRLVRRNFASAVITFRLEFERRAP
jgi:hypothetical protein